MINSFYINNFRLFKQLTINKLGMVNLIVGKNNSGKSCLLEAIRIYCANASSNILFDLIRERGEDWEIQTQRRKDQATQEIENPLRYLFYGYRFPKISEGSIEIGLSSSPQERLKLNLRAYKFIESEESRIFSRIEDKDSIENELDDAELVIELEKNNKTKPIVRLNREPRVYINLI